MPISRDITNELTRVLGGNRRQAFTAGARAAWNAVRPYVTEAAEQVATVAGSVALERAVDRVR